jgi:hypothetical protein
MPRFFILTALTLCVAAGARAAQGPCAEFARSVKATYNFRPSQLKGEDERAAKSAAMDRFWDSVKANKAELLPCLRAALSDPQANNWFRFDGSNLLVFLDPSQESKAEQVRQYAAVDLDDVDLQLWLSTLARRAAEGFDVSEAAARWLAYQKAEYYLPQHGAYRVTKFEGALYLYGSMDEVQATPALLKIVKQPGHPGRDYAAALLTLQATPEALRALKALDPAGLSAEARAALRGVLEKPRLFEPRANPKTSREEFLKAFEAVLKGDYDDFFELTEKVPDGERDAVAVLKPEDLPLVRRVRRQIIAAANPHAAEYYDSFTRILLTLVWRPELVK